MSSLTREAREAASPNGTIEFDQANAIVSIMVKIAHKFNILTPNLIMNMQHKTLWRTAVAKYYEVDEAESKTILMRAVFGFPSPAERHVQHGCLPLLQGGDLTFFVSVIILVGHSKL